MFKPGDTDRGYLRVVQFAAPLSDGWMDGWAGVLGTVGWTGWLEEGGKEGKKWERSYPGRVFMRKFSQRQELV